MKTILEDERTIKSITMSGTREHDGGHYVAKDGVTIEVYPEPAQYCYVAWFAIIEDGEIVNRLNCVAVETIEYEVVNCEPPF